MPNPTRPRDPNQLAKLIADIATGQGPDEPIVPSPAERGREGGKKGGPARARKLSAAERSKIAKKAAAARWRR